MKLVASANPVAESDKRTVTGLVVPWGKPGYTSTGAVHVREGAINVPADLKRVKLLRDHSTQPGFTPVGYAINARVTNEGLEMSFVVGRTPDGDTALTDVREGIRDAFSVELIDTKVRGGELTAGILTAVALVPIPAFADARVNSLHAALHDNERPDMPDIPETDTTADNVNNVETAVVEETTEEATDPGATEGEGAQIAAPLETETETETEETEEMGKHDIVTAAKAPTGLTVIERPKLTFSQAVNTIAAVRTGEARPEMTAALADITRSANPAVGAVDWLGELWSGNDYVREIIPTMTNKPLKSMRGTGWRWVTKPEVDDYAGDKTEVPTNEVSTEPVEVVGKRLAAGHDIDRAYFDFNETEFLQSFFQARSNDYAFKSDERAAQFLVESAGTGTTVAMEPDLLHAAARARMLVKQQTRTEPNAYLVNPVSMFGLFQITQLDNPAYLDLLGVNPEKFITSDLVPEGQVIAYAKPAVTWYELPGSPIRVDAERIDHGGKDSGIFGYYATLLNDQRGIVSVPFATPGDIGG